jgi:hypothetical protein
VENPTQLLNWLMRFVHECSGWLHEITLTGTLYVLVVMLVVVGATRYLSQLGLYLLQKILEVARLLLKVLAILVVVVAVLASGRYAWTWFKSSERICTGAFFEKIISCKPLNLIPNGATTSDIKSTTSLKKERNTVKPSVKEKTRKICKDKQEV